MRMLPYLTNDFYTIATGDDTSDITFGGESADGLTFSDMKGVAYDDPMWDDLLNQLDLQEAILFITQGNRNAPPWNPSALWAASTPRTPQRLQRGTERLFRPQLSLVCGGG